MDFGQSGGLDDVLVGRVRLGKTDVVSNRRVQQDGLLQHGPDVRNPGCLAGVAQIMAVDQYPP